jgi:hypothetical protein
MYCIVREITKLIKKSAGHGTNNKKKKKKKVLYQTAEFSIKLNFYLNENLKYISIQVKCTAQKKHKIYECVSVYNTQLNPCYLKDIIED